MQCSVAHIASRVPLSRLPPSRAAAAPAAAPHAASGACASRRLAVCMHARLPPTPHHDTQQPTDSQSQIPRPAKLPASTQVSRQPAAAAGPAAAAATAALLLPLVLPEAAEAADLLPGGRGYWLCIGLGGAAVLTTLLWTSRFLMSYFPDLEKRAKQRPSAVLLRALTLTDPLLDPITKGVFGMTEKGDLNYGAMAALALTSAVMTSLLGDGGLMVDTVPDLSLLQALRYVTYVQHMVLLPCWVMVVFRWFLLI